MKQSDDPKAFFEKYQFTASIEEPHPIHKDIMYFEGLEANYVSRLEHQVEQLNKFIQYQNEKIDFLMNREMYVWKRQQELGK